jgi:hypothetical protein
MGKPEAGAHRTQTAVAEPVPVAVLPAATGGKRQWSQVAKGMQRRALDNQGEASSSMIVYASRLPAKPGWQRT